MDIYNLYAVGFSLMAAGAFFLVGWLCMRFPLFRLLMAFLLLCVCSQPLAEKLRNGQFHLTPSTKAEGGE